MFWCKLTYHLSKLSYAPLISKIFVSIVTINVALVLVDQIIMMVDEMEGVGTNVSWMTEFHLTCPYYSQQNCFMVLIMYVICVIFEQTQKPENVRVKEAVWSSLITFIALVAVMYFAFDAVSHAYFKLKGELSTA